MRIKAIIFVTAAVLLVAVGSLTTMRSSASEGKGSRAIEGSWNVRLSPRSQTPEFDELITFAAGGGIVESNNFPFHTMQLAAGTGHGTWAYAGAQTFNINFVKLLFAPNGQWLGTLKAMGSITYSPDTDTWSGPANVFICIPANNCVQIDTTDGEATRIPAGS